MRKKLILIMFVLVGLVSCDRPRMEYWEVNINTDCEVCGVKDPGHNIAWICNDIVGREEGDLVLWPPRVGYQEFYTIWTNKEDPGNQLIALTCDEHLQDTTFNPWEYWQCFWNCDHEIVFGDGQTDEERYNYICEYFTCTDTICVMECVKKHKNTTF